MYIPPGFTLIACETVSEEELRLWAVENGAVWLPAANGQYGRRRANAQWNLGLEAWIMTLTDEDRAEWTPLMHKPPQSRITVELSELLWGEEELCAGLIGARLTCWDGYASDIGAHEWVSALLRDLLPADRIIRYELPPPGPPSAWVWIKGIYQKNEALPMTTETPTQLATKSSDNEFLERMDEDLYI